MCQKYCTLRDIQLDDCSDKGDRLLAAVFEPVQKAGASNIQVRLFNGVNTACKGDKLSTP